MPTSSAVLPILRSAPVHCVNKKLSCRRETATCFVPLNISLSHSRSRKVIETGTVRKLGYRYDFPFAFHSNDGSILYHFQDKARYWLKGAFLSRVSILTRDIGRAILSVRLCLSVTFRYSMEMVYIVIVSSLHGSPVIPVL